MKKRNNLIYLSVFLMTISSALIIKYIDAAENNFIKNQFITSKYESEKDEHSNREAGIVEMLKWQFDRLKNPSTNTIPENIRNKELEFAKSLPTSVDTKLEKGNNSITGSNWILRGPNNQGGRTKAIAVDVNDENIILAGAADGGIWRSTDKGASWTPTTDPSYIQNVNCLVQDTRPGKTNNWYYGTGELKANVSVGNSATATFLGNGIYKSTDNGLSWKPIISTYSNSADKLSNPFQIVWNIEIDTSNYEEDIFYVASSFGILKSTDGGTNWNFLLRNYEGSSYGYYTDLELTAHGDVFAAMNFGSNSGIYYSPDGENFMNISPGDWPSAVARIELASAPSNGNILYVLANTPGVGRDGWWLYEESSPLDAHSLWKYDLSTDSWQNLSQNLPPWESNESIKGYSSQRSYDIIMKVKPDDENFVILGGVNLYKTTDGFSTLLSENDLWIGGYSNEDVGPKAYENHHSDQHDVYFLRSNPNILYSAHDGGISVTNNISAEQVKWESLNAGYITTQFYSVALDHVVENSPYIIGGMQDNGSRMTNSLSPLSDWEQIGGGDGAYAAIADSATHIYYSSQNGNLMRLNQDVHLSIKPQNASGFLFITPYILDPNNTNVMFLAAGNKVWRNSNLSGIPNKDSDPWDYYWSYFESDTDGRVTALGASPSNSDILLVGTERGKIYGVKNRSDITSPLIEITGPNLPRGYVSSIAVDPNNVNNVLVAYSNYGILSLFYSSDMGRNWQNVSGNLEVFPDGSGPGPSVRNVKIMPINGVNVFLAGTSVGLFATAELNGYLTNWVQQAPNEIGNVIVESLDIRVIDGTIVAGTFGKGVYSYQFNLTSVEDQNEKPNSFVLNQNYPNPFNPSTTISFSLPKAVDVKLKVYDSIGREVTELINTKLAAGMHELEFNAGNLASGIYLYKLITPSFTDTKKMMLVK